MKRMEKSMDPQVQSNAAALERLASEIENANGSPSAQAMAVADQVIHRASAAMSDVHAHAMARVSGMREQLDDLEQTIVAAKERAELHMQKFMKLVTDGEEAIHAMELAVARISDQVLTPH
jgi:TolA-binding protein